MGSFDCYCALCSGPLGIYFIKLGSTRAAALEVRRKRVENKRRRLLGEKVEHEDSKEWQDREKEEFAMAMAEKEAGAERGEGDGDGDSQMKDVEEEEEDDGGEWVEEEDGDEDGESSDLDDESWDDDETSIATNEVAELAIEAEEWDNRSPDQSDADNESENNNSVSGDLDADFDDGMSRASELSLPDSFDFHRDTRDETSDMFSFYEEHSYDPTKIKREDFQWTDRCRVLGINPDLEDEKKAFISGRGRYDDLFDFRIKKPGNDPKDPGLSTYFVYHACEPQDANEEQQLPTFPFHEECFKLLARRLGYNDRKDVDKDILYAVMKQNTEPLPRALELDYGPVDGPEQFWECYAGEEWAVMDPGPRYGIEEVVKSMLPASLFDRQSAPTLDLAHKVRSDPLTVLPYDVLHGIFARLSIKDTLSLVNASWHVFESTREHSFWRQMIHFHIVPFFYELKDLFKNMAFPDTFDWRGAFQWLNEITKPKFAMEGPLNPIANRRRIWNACGQLAPLYHEKLYAEAYQEPSGEEAAAIMSTAKAYHTPVTLFPQPPANEATTVTSQFIRSWSEVGHRACDFDTYWADSYGNLTGISVNFGSGLRIFGSADGVKGQSLHIPSGEWIKEIRLLIRNIEIYQGEKKEITGPDDVRALGAAGITGMQVFLTNGVEKLVRGVGYDRNHRSMQVLDGLCIVGLTGEIATNGTISRLGLLQAVHPSTPLPTSQPTYHPTQTHLWTSRAASVYAHSGLTHPIWTNPTKRLYTFPLPDSPPSYPQSDMLPHHILCWAQTPTAHSVLQRICFLQVRDDHGLSILGIWQKTTNKHGSAEHIGTAGPVPAQLPDEWARVGDVKSLGLWDKVKAWDERFMAYFDIDGPGGEVVCEVHVTRDRRAVRLVSSWGREGEFGDVGEGGGDGEWDIRKAGEGEVVVGLSGCFGRLGCWSEGARRWSHWGMSDVGVVAARTGDARV